MIWHKGNNTFIDENDEAYVDEWYANDAAIINLILSDEDYICFQCTGMTTNNNSPIYDGHIVYIAGIGQAVVTWNEGTAGWCFETTDDYHDYIDVIGDIERIDGHVMSTKFSMWREMWEDSNERT